ncbi:MAG: FtsX-like permease family protein [Anaerolineales bacterium]|nr:MAG: FtsX-like permease family protein [Anaerolineales bacterium]
MSTIWRKVWRDLTHNKARTALVVLAMAIGIYSVGMAFGMSELTRTRLIETHQASVMAHIRFWMASRFDQDVVETIADDPELADVEGVSQDQIRWRLEGEAEWREMRLIARPDFRAQRMNRVELLEGVWPAGDTLAVERLTSNYYGISPGAVIVSECGEGECRLSVGGVARGQIVPPPQYTGEATFYCTPEAAARLTGRPEGFNGLLVQLESFTPEGAEEAALRLGRQMETLGLSMTGEGYFITDPDVHWAQEQVDTIMLIMGMMGVGSLVLSGFLIANTMSSIMVRQVWQVGVMKVCGATIGRITLTYLATALIHGLRAMRLAVPSAAIAAYLISSWILDTFNVPLDSFQVAPGAILIQVAVALAVPLLGALVPVIAGARRTARQAIGSRGLGGATHPGRLDRLAGRVRGLPRPLVLSLRNTFRNKARIALTLTTLVLAGAMFVGVVSIKDSMDNTFEALFSDLGHDVLAQLDRPYETAHVEEATEGLPDTELVEVWSGAWAAVSLPEGRLREAYLWGVPAGSEMFSPRIVAGRNLVPQDERAVLLNRQIAEDEGIQVGDEVELVVGRGQSTWRVVGLVLSMRNGQRESFVPLDAVAAEATGAGKGNLVLLGTSVHDLATQQRVGSALGSALVANGINATHIESAIEERESSQSMFAGVVYILLVGATLAAVVGGLGLASTMSINVVERQREIGMMRATGATSAAVALLFVGEGVFIGLLSWLLAMPLSYPSAHLFGSAVADTLIRVPLDFSYSTESAFLWLLAVVVLSSLASIWPALRATKVSVREALSYE